MASGCCSYITAPSIRMNHSIWRHVSRDNGLQCCFGAIWYNLCIYLFIMLKHAKDNFFTINATTFFSSYMLCAKIGVIDLY